MTTLIVSPAQRAVVGDPACRHLPGTQIHHITCNYNITIIAGATRLK